MAMTPESTNFEGVQSAPNAIEISAATREVVQKAAKKQGVPAKEWVENTLRKAAKNVLMGGPPVLALPDELLDTLSDISTKIAELTKQQTADLKVVTQLENTVTDLKPRAAKAMDQLKKLTSDMVNQAVSTSENAISRASEAAATTLETLSKSARAVARKNMKKRKRAKSGASRTRSDRNRKGSSHKRKNSARKRG
jgi:paraquat-inducible protein B